MRILPRNASWYERLCAKASGAVLCHTPEHESDHGKADPGFFTAGKQLIVLGESTPGGEPGEGSFHNPRTFQHVGAARTDLLRIDDGVIWGPDATLPSTRALHRLHLPGEQRRHHPEEARHLERTRDPDELA